MKLILERAKTELDHIETRGKARLLDDNGSCVYVCKSLELPWKNNIRQKSCIPLGVYKVIPRVTKRFGKHFEVLNVPGRDKILFHVFNYIQKPVQSLGCIAVGLDFKDMNKDKIPDITNSRIALDKLVELCPNGFTLEIVSA